MPESFNILVQRGLRSFLASMFSCILLLAFVVFLFPACDGKKDKGAGAPVERSFPPMPTVPSMITDANEAYEYIATHFWDAFLGKSYPCDSSLVNGVRNLEVEKAFGMYAALLEMNCSRDFATKAMSGLFSSVERFGKENDSSNVFGFFEKMVPKFLYDPNSPYRDEDLYLPYVSGLSVSDLVSEDMRQAYSYDASMCSINRAGTPAADFSFTDLKGRRHNLHGIKAGHTLLFFSNPGCHACKEIMEKIEGNKVLQTLISDGKLAVVNVYIDRDITEWKALAKDYPASWYSGYDQDYSVRSGVKYNVRAIPSLYLLDSEKNVVLKDAPEERIIQYLEKIR